MCGNWSERAGHERRRTNGSQKNISTGNCDRTKVRIWNGVHPAIPDPKVGRFLAGEERDPEGLFQQESYTEDPLGASDKINERNGRPVGDHKERTFEDLLGSKWSQYVDNQCIKPSTRCAYASVLKHWIKPS